MKLTECLSKLIPSMTGVEQKIDASLDSVIGMHSDPNAELKKIMVLVRNLDQITMQPLKSHISKLYKTITNMEKEPRAYEKMCGIEEYVTGTANASNSAITWELGENKIVTCSPIQECELIVFILGCIALEAGVNMIKGGNINITTSSLLTLATQCFEWRCSLTPGVGLMEYDSSLPPYRQKRVCRALYFFSIAAFQICDLNASTKNAYTNADIILVRLYHIRDNLIRSFSSIQSALSIVRGFDLRPLSDVIECELECYRQWHRVYTAIMHFNESPAPDSELEVYVMDTLTEVQSKSNTVSMKAEIGTLISIITPKLKTSGTTMTYKTMSWIADKTLKMMPTSIGITAAAPREFKEFPPSENTIITASFISLIKALIVD